MALGLGSGLVFSSPKDCGCNAAKIVWNNTQTGNSIVRFSLNVFTGTRELNDTIRLQCNLRASVPFDSDSDDTISFNLKIGTDIIGTKQVPFDGSAVAIDNTSDPQTNSYVNGTIGQIFHFHQTNSDDRPLANSYLLISDVIITVKDDEDNVKQVIKPDFSECGSVSDFDLTPNNGTMSKLTGACN